MYVNIIPLTKIPLAKPQVYTYEAGDLANDLKIGQVVEVPLYNRVTAGIVAGFSETAPANIIYKKVARVLDLYSIVSERDLKLARFISEYYYSSLGLVLKQLTPELPRKQTKKLLASLAKINLSLINLSYAKGQERKGTAPYLLIGAPTERLERYREAIIQTLKEKKQILFLVPELILLTQTELWLKQNFSHQTIALLHSDLSKSNQLINWRQAQTGGALIFLGARQAVFASFYDLGLIIVEEEQNLSYKQWDMNPRYDARTVAEKKAALYNCRLIFGANAPTINAYFKAQTLPPRFHFVQAPLLSKEGGNIPTIPPLAKGRCPKGGGAIIDMRQELSGGNYSIFSDALQQALAQTLRQKKQAIIFVNRRGESTFVMCRDCGAVLRCPRCNIALMEHANKTLSCNHCNYKTASPLACPACRSPRIKGFGIGVEKVEMELKKIGGGARIARLDAGSASRQKNIKQRYAEFTAGQIDILVGTQIALPITSANLELIAAINIDSILNFPDWRTDERAWHILRQITGRNDIKRALIQTYNPENKILRYISRTDFDGFYQEELKNRKIFQYPPYLKIIKLICKSDDYDYLLRESVKIAEKLKQEFAGQKIIGPIRPIPEKMRNFWQREIIIKLDLNYKNDKLENILRNLTGEWSIDIDPLT